MISLSPPPNAAASASLTPWHRARRHEHPHLPLPLGGRHGAVRTLAAAPSSSSSTSFSSAAVSAPPADEPRRAVVVGAGLAGLAAAIRLQAAGIPVVVLEASDGVGGRVRTDAVDGFLLDRGFQILITAYPEACRILDYAALDLQRFYSGALVYAGGGQFHRIADPLRHPVDGVASLLNPVGNPVDKLRVGLARFRAAVQSDADILTAAEVPIIDRLRAEGFTDSIIEGFFRPFFGGVFFDRELGTTSRLFEFVFKCLALGDNALPSRGIGAISEQLAARLKPGTIRLGSRAVAIDPETSDGRVATVSLEGGEVIKGELGVIVAVEGPKTEQLLPWAAGREDRRRRPPRSTTCLYYCAERAPLREPILLLNGSGEGMVNNMFFATNVAPSYAPPGKTLVSVSLIGAAPAEVEGADKELAAEVARELGGWFGEGEVAGWRHLRTYRVAYAQPDQCPPTEVVGRDPREGDGVYLCGDHMRSATFDGALASGRAAAEALIGDRVPSRGLRAIV
ncbi:hypothetical protein Taro_043483 [Colocasia esculenta]|uniref:Amine oxidase domain-containing protein n=1 Tax=Colocasia esculenta TaxID=4460 RepID=A0A843WVX0_COLES|nr:hypothetical protein [Colocasia esculenta]